jgi:transcriptional regulator with XRE-family HTH domain
MKSDKSAAAKSFGARLRSVMAEKGLISKGSRSGVDVPKLAEIAQTTYEMARRYAEGVAIPRPDKLQAIADWLGVEPGTLAWGESTQSSAVVDGELLQKCLTAVMHAQNTTGRHLSMDQAAHIVAVLYQEAATGRMPAADGVELMVKALAR